MFLSHQSRSGSLSIPCGEGAIFVEEFYILHSRWNMNLSSVTRRCAFGHPRAIAACILSLGGRQDCTCLTHQVGKALD